MYLVFTMHGQALYAHGVPDFSKEIIDYKPLTQSGIDQSIKLGDYLFDTLGDSVNAIVTSPCIRAKETAKIIHVSFNLPLEMLIAEDELTELNQEECEIYKSNRDRALFLARKRIHNWLDNASANYKIKGKAIIFVTHRYVIQSIIKHINGSTLTSPIDDASYTVLNNTPKGLDIVSINNNSYLQ
jgi:broad specificity phosphatase PhoE